MVKKLLSKSLDNFLAHNDQHVVILKGGWGVGKTFSWGNYVENCTYVKGHNYSYVSLFGMKSIQDIKHQILFNSTNVSSKKNLLDKPKDYIKNLTGFVNSVPYIKELKGNLIEDIFLKSGAINETLICLDDIERSDVSILNILGLVDSLKNDYKCKLVIIMNDLKLGKESKKILDVYREKVIDFEIEVESSICEIVDIYFDKSDLLIINDFLKITELKNIRVIQKTSWVVAYFKKIVRNVNKDLKIEILNHILFLSYTYFNSGNESILKDVLGTKNYDPMREEKITDESRQYFELSNIVGYYNNGYDEYIFDYLVLNSFDEESFLIEIEGLSLRYDTSNVDTLYQKTWSIVSSNFTNNDEDVVNIFEDFLEGNVYKTSYDNIVSMEVFISLIKESKTSKWSELYIKNCLENNEISVLEKIWESIENEDLKIDVLNFLVEKNKKESAAITLGSYLDFEFLIKHNVKEISRFGESDYYDWVVKSTKENHISYIKKIIKIIKKSNDKVESDKVIFMMHKVLYEISKDSVLNQKRVSKIIGKKYLSLP